MHNSLSIPRNMAKGFERNPNKDENMFFHYAKGSCAQLRTYIYTGIETGYINEELGLRWKNETEQRLKTLFAFIKTRSSRSFRP